LAKVEFTFVNPCRESNKKPLGEGRIHLRECLPRVRKRKPLGEGRSHQWIPAESLIRNLLAKVEFPYMNPCQESVKENLLAKVEFTYVNPAESPIRNLLVKVEFTYVNPCQESDKKPLGEGRIHLRQPFPRVR